MSDDIIEIDDQHCLTSQAFPDFKVWIVIEDEAAQVYGVESKRGPGEITRSEEELHCALEGKSGARFSIWSLDNRTNSESPMVADYYLEGENVGSHDLYLSSPYFVTPQNHEGRLRAVYEMIVDEHHVQPFQLGAVPHTDNKASAVDDDKVISSAATISLKLHRCKDIVALEGSPSFTVVPDIKSKIEENVLDERQKKAQFAFAAGVGEIKERDLSTIKWTGCIGMESAPFVQYVFTVWSRDGLEIKGYIEGDKEPDVVKPEQPTRSNSYTKRARSPSDATPVKSSSSKVRVAKKTKAAQEVIDVDVEEDDSEVKPIVKGNTLYIDFDDDEVENEEKKKA